MKKSGLCSVTFRNLEVEEILKLCKDNSVSAIEWGGDVHVPSGEFSIAEKVKKLSDEYGIEMSSYGSYFRCDDLEKFIKVSETAKILGCLVIRIWAGEKDGEKYTEEEFRALVETVIRCADYAKENGQIIAFEYHFGTYCNDSFHVEKLLNAVNRDNVKTYWQPAYWLKESIEEQKTVDLQTIKELKENIVNVHVYFWTEVFTRKTLEEGFAVWEE
ncbi:MAG: sugar phosphate isomerase/epimerase, partial [Clostridia bacterium]|nr:sugar phosphate isomerase/epimerase [Clostridia bacterium]